jgi:hypothetical protein
MGWDGRRQFGLRQHLFHHVAMHVGQAEVPSLEFEGQLGVIESYRASE